MATEMHIVEKAARALCDRSYKPDTPVVLGVPEIIHVRNRPVHVAYDKAYPLWNEFTIDAIAVLSALGISNDAIGPFNGWIYGGTVVKYELVPVTLQQMRERDLQAAIDKLGEGAE